ncbi:MAG TPA: PPOX class F420-dependent oxidoreductase [Anaerolineales bacterium]
MKNIPETHSDLLKDEKKAFVYLATQMPNGSPQVTPVWFNTDGEFILINSAKRRVKDRNMRARPQVALCIQDPSNPYRYLQIHGKVIEFTTEGADDHIDALTLKYRGIPKYPSRQPGEQRIKYKIQIEKVDAHG